MNFYVGLHQPSDAKNFSRCMVSVTRLRSRKADFTVSEWMMDSGAFSEISTHGRFRSSVAEYAAQVARWSRCGNLVAAVSQDFMCEPFILAKTGMTTGEHQRLTIERYDGIREKVRGTYILPVLQGYWPEEYVRHLDQYGERLGENQWVGVGSVCKRNVNVEEIESVLMSIKRARPDLRLHGFGIKITALESSVVRDCLWSADSMAWSYAARKQGRGGNNWDDARLFVGRIDGQRIKRKMFQDSLF